jgi:hypothetical protein
MAVGHDICSRIWSDATGRSHRPVGCAGCYSLLSVYAAITTRQCTDRCGPSGVVHQQVENGLLLFLRSKGTNTR